MDRERARVHVADRVDQAHHPSGPAQVEPGQGLAVAGEVEERVAGQHLVAVRDQPVVQLALLLGGDVQFVPHIGAASGRAQPGDPQLRVVALRDRLERVELPDVRAGHHDRDLEAAESGVVQVAHRADRGVVRPAPAHRVVHLGRRAVERDLHVDVVAGGQPARDVRRDLDAVGRELHADVVFGRVVDEFPEVGTDGGFAAADVDVEDLHALELVDDRLALGGGQLARVAPSGRGQAVHAGQVAGVGEFPGQADGSIEAELELVDERQGRGGHGRRSVIMSDVASVARAAR